MSEQTNQHPTPPRWLTRLAILAGAFTLCALAGGFYLLCAVHVALNGF